MAAVSELATKRDAKDLSFLIFRLNELDTATQGGAVEEEGGTEAASEPGLSVPVVVGTGGRNTARSAFNEAMSTIRGSLLTVRARHHTAGRAPHAASLPLSPSVLLLTLAAASGARRSLR